MMKYFYEKIHPKLKSNNRLYWYAREWFVIVMIFWKSLFNKPFKEKKRVLFYYIHALGYGGTSSLMQILAKHLDKKKYQVYIMYSEKPIARAGSLLPVNTRQKFVEEGGVRLIPFDFQHVDEMP